MKFIFPKIILKIEKWKWNKEYRVYVSNLGHIKDENKNPIPVLTNNSGYLSIRTPNGIVKVHRIIMKTFCPTIDMENLTIDHLDHNKRNNSLENLEWVTKEENKQRAARDFIKVEDLIKNEKKVIKVYKKNKKENIEITFNNYNEAGAWLIADQKMINTNTTKIGNKIKQSIDANKTYCNYKFIIVEG